jgi:two-component system NtrC family sensor kinase
MMRLGGSISLRLAVGFMLILAVFAVALLVSLYNLDKIKKASEETRVRQEVRRKALEVGRLAEELFVRQREFVEAAGVPWKKVNEFGDVHDRMEEELQDLLQRPVEEPERGYLENLGAAGARMRTIFLDKIVRAKVLAGMGADVDPSLDELLEESHSVLNEISGLNERLSLSFETRAIEAETHVDTAWDVTLAITKSIFPLALLMSLLIIYYTHRSIVQPVGSLLGGTRALAEGRLSTRIEVTGSGEFIDLAAGFNSMAQALEQNQKQLVEAEKLASVGRLAAGVAHEINNPIAVILGYSTMLLGSLGDEASEKEQIQTIAEEARQCKTIVDGLLDLSRPSDPTGGETVNPCDVLAEVLNTVHALQITDGIRIEESVVDRPIPLSIGRARLRQLALNIVRNALEALKGAEDGRLRIEGFVRPRTKVEPGLLKDAPEDARSFLILVFSDNGPGIPAENLPHMFEPFFTTKSDGMGLGLAITYNIARSHGGFIDVQSAVGEGTTFTVGLPVTA